VRREEHVRAGAPVGWKAGERVEDRRGEIVE